MVAPYTLGRLSRSLVSLPSNGTGGHREAVCIDFSRVSTAAAIDAAHYPPPSGFPRTPHLRTTSTNVQKMATSSDAAFPEATGVARGASVTALPPVASLPSANGFSNSSSSLRAPRRKRSRGQQEGASVPPAKAPRPSPAAAPQGSTEATLRVAGGTGPLQRGVQGVQVLMVPVGPPVMLKSDTMRELVEERNILRQQNAALAQRVRAFQMLFRNKDKLTGVLRVMGLTVV